MDDWEGGATALPATKKRLEGAFVAVVDGVGVLGVGLLVTPRTNVSQRDVSVRVDLVRSSLGTTFPAIELDADILRFQVVGRDPIDDGILGLPARSVVRGALTTTTTATRLGAGDSLEVFLVCQWLRGDVRFGADRFETFFYGGPRVSPLESFHLPGHMNFMVSLDDNFVIVMKGHLDQELQQRELIGEFVVESRFGCFCRELREHSVDELVESEVLVRDHIVPRHGRLQHLVRPRALSEDHARANFVVASREDLLHLGNIARLDLSVDFEGRCGEHAESRCHACIDHLVCFQLTVIAAHCGAGVRMAVRGLDGRKTGEGLHLLGDHLLNLFRSDGKRAGWRAHGWRQVRARGPEQVILRAVMRLE